MATFDDALARAANTTGLTGAAAAAYDRIMKEIDPELTTEHIPLLDAQYASETPEQTQVRMARYDAAFEEYDKRIQAEFAAMDAVLTKMQHSAMASLEHEQQEADAQNISAIEQSFKTA